MSVDLDSAPHLTAVQAKLAAVLPYPIALTWAPTSGQYAVLTAPSWQPPDDTRLASGDLGLDIDVRVKAVTGTPDGVAIMLRDIRAQLSPALLPSRLDVPGWETWIRWVRSEFVDVDESTTLPGTNRHPAFGVETYRLVAEPTAA